MAVQGGGFSRKSAWYLLSRKWDCRDTFISNRSGSCLLQDWVEMYASQRFFCRGTCDHRWFWELYSENQFICTYYLRKVVTSMHNWVSNLVASRKRFIFIIKMSRKSQFCEGPQRFSLIARIICFRMHPPSLVSNKNISENRFICTYYLRKVVTSMHNWVSNLVASRKRFIFIIKMSRKSQFCEGPQRFSLIARIICFRMHPPSLANKNIFENQFICTYYLRKVVTSMHNWVSNLVASRKRFIFIIKMSRKSQFCEGPQRFSLIARIICFRMHPPSLANKDIFENQFICTYYLRKVVTSMHNWVSNLVASRKRIILIIKVSRKSHLVCSVACRFQKLHTAVKLSGPGRSHTHN